jgi:small GTP-binding protein
MMLPVTFSSPMSISQARLRLIVVGDAGVGKTSVILNYTKGLPSGNTRMTVGVECRTRNCDSNGVSYRLDIWDTAGEEKYQLFATRYFCQAEGIMLFYSITSRESFNNLSHWKEIADNTKSADFPFIVLGNRADMVDKREVISEEGQRCARLRLRVHRDVRADRRGGPEGI